jgi:XTP/dITP diphosphohydrolase
MTIYFATGNIHKKQELAGILPDHCIKIPADAGIHDFAPEENGSSFLENSLIKARALYRLVRQPVIADDSGICVDALSGRPGIYSARYGDKIGSAKLSDAERNALLLSEVGDNPNRAARFVCAMALVLSEDRFFVVQETLEGRLIEQGRGSGGIGYDPVLYIPELGRTVAELSADEKNRVSHRGKAGRAIVFTSFCTSPPGPCVRAATDDPAWF